MTMDTSQIWDFARLTLVAYIVFAMNKNDRDHREAQLQSGALFKDLFSRIRKIEIRCASNHGHVGIHREDDDES